MNKNPLISILIPMYNAEATISRCLSSICSQEPMIFEIIVIDDGSTDSGYDIAKSYAEQYSFIYLYQQKNEGVSRTRQNLIHYANGKYIMFCDADDYFEPNAIKTVYKLFQDTKDKERFGEEINLYVFGYKLIRMEGEKVVKTRKLPEGIHKKDEFSKYHVQGFSDLYWSALWNKCYKKEIYSLSEISFEYLMEDVMFNIDYISRCSNIYVCSIPIYDYVQIGESLTRSKKKDKTSDILFAQKAFQTLHEKAIKAYPNEQRQIDENFYMLMKNLILRADKINNIELKMKLREDCNSFRDQIGVRYVLFECKWILSSLKNIMRKIVKMIRSN